MVLSEQLRPARVWQTAPRHAGGLILGHCGPRTRVARVRPSLLGVRGCGRPFGNAAQQVGRAALRPPMRDQRRSAAVESGRKVDLPFVGWAKGRDLGSVAPGAVSWRGAIALAWGCGLGLCLNLGREDRTDGSHVLKLLGGGVSPERCRRM